MKKLFLFAAIVLISPVYAANPFLSSNQNNAASQPLLQKSQPQLLMKVLRPVFNGQRVLYKKVSHFMKSLKEDPKPKIVLLLFGTLFAYGFLHALGPGHGKLFIFSYVVSKKIRLLNACLIGTIVAFFHASLSVVLVVVLDLILEKSVLLSVDRAEYWLKIISYFLVLALGGYLMYHALSHFKSPDTHHRKNSKEEKKDRNFVMMAISIAMVPCPGTILILLFAMSNQLFGLGLLSVACMAAGMAVSLSLISTTTAFAREKGIGLIVHSEKMQDRVSGIATFAGSVIIVLTSIVMLAGTIRI